MRPKLVILAVIAIFALVAKGEAQTPLRFPNSLVVVPAGRLSRIGFTTNLDITCRLREIVPIDVVNPPAAGEVFLKNRTDYPIYNSRSNRYACNKFRRPGTEILYKSRQGFVGTDRFVLRFLDENHTPIITEYTVQVQ